MIRYIFKSFLYITLYLINKHFLSIRTAAHTLNDSLFPALVEILDSIGEDKTDLSKQSPQEILCQLKNVTDPEEKHELWNKLSFSVFTRCSTLILAASYLTALTHIQFSILAGYTYKNLISNSSSQNGNTSKTYNSQTTNNTHKQNFVFGDDVKELFLADVTNNFLLYGVTQIQQFLAKDAIPKTMGNLKLSQFIALPELSDLLRSMIRSSLSSGM